MHAYAWLARLAHQNLPKHVIEANDAYSSFLPSPPFPPLLHPPLDNIRVMLIVWRLRGNITRTALCWIVWHNVYSQQHTYMNSSYRSNRLGLSHRDLYPVRRGGCLELYYCNMVEWFWWDSRLISTTNWFPSVLWHCWFGHRACKKSSPKWPIMCGVGRTYRVLKVDFCKYYKMERDFFIFHFYFHNCNDQNVTITGSNPIKFPDRGS